MIVVLRRCNLKEEYKNSRLERLVLSSFEPCWLPLIKKVKLIYYQEWDCEFKKKILFSRG